MNCYRQLTQIEFSHFVLCSLHNRQCKNNNSFMISFKTTIWKKKYLAVKKDLKMCVCEDNFQMFNRLQLKSLKIHMSSMWVSYTLYIFTVFDRTCNVEEICFVLKTSINRSRLIPSWIIYNNLVSSRRQFTYLRSVTL